MPSTFPTKCYATAIEMSPQLANTTDLYLPHWYLLILIKDQSSLPVAHSLKTVAAVAKGANHGRVIRENWCIVN